MKMSIILLAGGQGTRMNSATPKQFLPLRGKPIALHSFDLFLSLDLGEIIVVAAPEYRSLFPQASAFALPGKRRQDSVYNGLEKVSPDTELVCIHDAARPFLTKEIVEKVLSAAAECGAATVGVPAKQTIKECDPNTFVVRTPDRATLWEIQTPQVVKASILHKGFSHALQHGLTVTDDVSLAELVGSPVKIVEGTYTNIKITTPEDLLLAEKLHEQV